MNDPIHSKPDQSLPRSVIIRRRDLFDRTRTEGKRVNHPALTLQYLRPGPETTRIGLGQSVAFLTPRRLGPAALRNRLRRRLREIYRRDLPPVGAGYRLIWVARPPLREVAFAELRQIMSELRSRVR